MEFFISLFGIAYYVYFISINRTKKREVQNILHKKSDFSYRFGELIIASRDLENEIETLIKNRDNGQYILNEIRDNLMEIYGDDFNNNFNISPQCKRTKYKISNGYWAKQLLLSKLGKVGCYEYYSGYPVGIGDEIKINLKFCEQIEKNLKSHGINIGLFLQPGISGDISRWNPCGKNIVFENHLCNCDDNKAMSKMW